MYLFKPKSVQLKKIQDIAKFNVTIIDTFDV